MNQAYKLVWNTTLQAWTVASELARGNKKSSGKMLQLAVLLAGGLAAGMASAAPAANALPTGESVASGTATFDRTVSNQLTVNQSSTKAIINWNSFDVGSSGKVVFDQPDTSSIALNRVTSASPTEIFGQVTANGQLFIVNPNGVTFGAGSQISASTLLASVLDISDSDFAADNFVFTRGTATGAINNAGTIEAQNILFLSPNINNSGSLTAVDGNVTLVNVDEIDATTQAMNQYSSIAGVIKNSGTIQATNLSSGNGQILLFGDSSQAESRIELSGNIEGETSSIYGQNVVVAAALDLAGNNTLAAQNAIQFNADVEVGGTGELALYSANGYSLNNVAKVNLLGSNASFSVNGDAFTVITDATQLQDMRNDLSGKYVLATDIDATDSENWDNGRGFAPVGNNSNKFSGILEGLGHQVNKLTVNRPTTDNVGLFGATETGLIQNIGLTSLNVLGRSNVGGIAGNNSSAINNAYVTGVVAGVNNVGGVAGINDSIINNAYATTSVTGSGTVTGGLAGALGSNGVINNAYASGAVAGDTAGGLVGESACIINNSYASGAVSGSNAGGLVASVTDGSVISSYWNTDTTGQASSADGTGLSTAQMQDANSFSGWDIDNQGGTGTVWRIYQGQTSPLLRSFLKPLSVDIQTLSNTRSYDGTTTSGLSYMLSNPLADLSKVHDNFSARNVGTYSYGDGLSSVQNGYDLSISNDGTLTINKASLVISSSDVSKTYDASTTAAGSAVLSSGSLFGSDSISGGTFAFDDKNAGTGKHVSVSGVSVNDGNNGNNYDVSYVDNTSSTINKRLLTISAVADSKVYDGKLTSIGKPVVTGRQRGDSIVSLTQSFADKNAGTGKTINVNGNYVIRDGNNGDNYTVVLVQSHDGVITPKALTISTVANTKVYDGGLTSANKPLVSGLVSGDRVTGLFQQYETKTVGTGKKLLIKAGYVVQDGNSGGNYSITEQTSNDGVITAH